MFSLCKEIFSCNLIASLIINCYQTLNAHPFKTKCTLIVIISLENFLLRNKIIKNEELFILENIPHGNFLYDFRNLQAAVGCYFDFLASSNQNNATVSLPSMRIVKELTVGLDESVTPNTQFTQSWLLENNGDVPWPQGCYLKLVSEINNDGKMFVPPIAPHETHIITINLVSPPEVGQFKSQFCLCMPNGQTFGPIIWSVVDVGISGTLALTQQLTQLHTSQPPKIQSSGWEDNMDSSSALNSSIATSLVPHCSNGITDPFPISHQVS
jgi:Ig-like domain from next to BRCA1 gene